MARFGMRRGSARRLVGGGSAATWIVLLALFGAGCDGLGPTAGTPDAGTVAPHDGGRSDASGRTDAGLPFDFCFGGDDHDVQNDCAPERCSRVPACCVASAREDCCRTLDPVELVRTIACGDEGTCLEPHESLRYFGGELPVLEDGGLVPQGGLGHGGVALADTVDPRAMNVTLDALIDVPTERCVDCVDVAGLALIESVPEPGARALVSFGVLVSGSRDELVVIVADEVVVRRQLVAGARSVRLTTDVEGAGGIHVDGEVIADIGGLSLPVRAYLTVLGRTSNRAGEPAVRVRTASATLAECDVPWALARRAAPVLPWSGASWSPDEVRRPSVVSWTDGDGVARALMAFAYGGEIFLAGRTGLGEFRHPDYDPGPPAFELTDELEVAYDPWLVIHDERFVLYFVGADRVGRVGIWRTAGGPRFGQTFGPPAPVIDPSALGVGELTGPTVLPGDRWRMVAREQGESGARLIELVSDDEGSTWTFARVIATPHAEDVFAFDRDDVYAPALIEVPAGGGLTTTRLYHAARRGTRSSIGLYVEGEGTWRRIGEVLQPGQQGFDAFGVADPAPLMESGAVRLYYAGTDGARFRIGTAEPSALLQ